MAKSLNLCSPNSYPNPKSILFQNVLKAQFFVEIIVDRWKIMDQGHTMTKFIPTFQLEIPQIPYNCPNWPIIWEVLKKVLITCPLSMLSFGIKSKMTKRKTKVSFLCNLALTPHCTIFLCCAAGSLISLLFVAISSVNMLPNFPWKCLLL